MENNVILSLAQELADNGYTTLRFNYRGVGGSQNPFKNVAEGFLYWESTFGDGNLEGPLEDTRQALSFLRSVEEGKTLLVGYSFGAVVGIRVGAEDSSVVGLAGIAAPCGAYNLDFLSSCPKPKLFICSDNDFAASVEETSRCFERFSGPKRLVVKEQTNHFYIGSEKEVAREVRQFFDGILAGIV